LRNVVNQLRVCLGHVHSPIRGYGGALCAAGTVGPQAAALYL